MVLDHSLETYVQPNETVCVILVEDIILETFL